MVHLFGSNLTAILRFLIAIILSLAILGGIIRLINYFLPTIGTDHAALIAFGGAILAAILKSYFDRAAQIETEKRKEKQRNYDELLGSIAKFIRDPKNSNDDFSTIHLKSWIYGNEEVVRLTRELIEINRGTDLSSMPKKIEILLRTMRTDIGLTPIDDKFEIINVFKAESVRGT